MRHTISLFILLSLFWLTNSGHYTFLLLSLGAASVVFAIYIAHRMDVIDHESQPLHLTTRLPGYIYWLIKKIIMSNIDVIKLVWSRKPDISPTIAAMHVYQKTDIGKVIYANTITLTPGTITVDVVDDVITVHSLTRKEIRVLQLGFRDKRVCRLERE